MKTFAPFLLAALAITVSGCINIERDDTPTRTVVVTDSAPVVRESVVTTLPVGYRTRVYRGTSYYYSGDVVYRSHPHGGYVVVSRPW